MNQSTPDISAVKDGMKNMWSTGNFAVIARTLEPAAEKFINNINIKPGAKVLDVACGSGNLAILAAKTGANTHGLDIVADLIRQAKERAGDDKLEIAFIEGDAEAMPYPDNEFDYVVSMFGAMFCPRPGVTASELFRVCRSGGTVAMANWTKDGFGDDFFAVVSKYAPPPPSGIPSPRDWGDESIVEERFAGKTSGLDMQRIKTDLYYPMNPAETVEHYFKYFGPTKSIHDKLDTQDRESFRKDLIEFFENYNKSTDGGTLVQSEYLEVIAAKR